jgi:hypothetical protein
MEKKIVILVGFSFAAMSERPIGMNSTGSGTMIFYAEVSVFQKMELIDDNEESMTF